MASDDTISALPQALGAFGSSVTFVDADLQGQLRAALQASGTHPSPDTVPATGAAILYSLRNTLSFGEPAGSEPAAHMTAPAAFPLLADSIAAPPLVDGAALPGGDFLPEMAAVPPAALAPSASADLAAAGYTPHAQIGLPDGTWLSFGAVGPNGS